jgi:selenocysteine lyase/cysteine desulfurase
MAGRPLDVARLREDTPGCARLVHLNNAGAALQPKRVVDAVVAHLRLEEAVGGYEAAERAVTARDRTYDAVAELVGCAREEVALVDSATTAWDLAFTALRLGEGDRVLTSQSEYASNALALLQAARRDGVVVDVIPDDEHGAVSVDALRDTIDDRVKLVAVNHVPSQSGLVNPAEEIGAVTRDAGVPYLLDACQSAGQIPLAVDAIGCDFLSATGRKYLRGPRGTGFLYVREEWLGRLEPYVIDVGSADWQGAREYEIRADARRFETFECSEAARIGLGVAVDYALWWGVESLSARITALAERLRDRLERIPGVTVRDPGVRRCGIVTFTVEGVEPAEVRRLLGEGRVNVWVVNATTARLDMDRRGLPAVVRASVHAYNTESELDRAVGLVAEAASGA